MATYGSATSPVTTVTGVSDTPNTIYSEIGVSVTVTTKSVVKITSIKSTKGATVALDSDGQFTYTLTATSGKIVFKAKILFSKVDLVFDLYAGKILSVIGRGTQDDPWTKWDGSAYQFWQSVTDGATYYATIGAYFNITDAGDPSGKYDYFVSYISPNLGITTVNRDAEGTATTAGTTNIEIQFNEETFKTIHLVILGNGPTLNVRVNGAWKEGKPYVKVNGVWKEATKVYIKVNGVWKESR